METIAVVFTHRVIVYGNVRRPFSKIRKALRKESNLLNNRAVLVDG
jgi:hypothetical protein